MSKECGCGSLLPKLCVTNTSLRCAMLECKHLTVEYHIDARSLPHIKLQIFM